MGTSISGFLALNNRYLIEGTLKFEGAVHIGSGFESTRTNSDAGFIAGAFKEGEPFVPGSSLRGVLRSLLERILKAAKPDAGCVLFADGSHKSCLTAKTKENRENALKEIEELYAGEPSEVREAEFPKYFCDICRLFGSPMLASKLRVDDCRLKSGQRADVRHGVGIDRDTETARAKIKYDFETVEGGPSFSLRLQIENAEGSDLALLGIVLNEMVHTGIHVGGKKSRGLGRCKLDEQYAVRYFDRSNLASFLTSGILPPRENFQKEVLQPALETYFNGGANAVAAT